MEINAPIFDNVDICLRGRNGGDEARLTDIIESQSKIAIIAGEGWSGGHGKSAGIGIKAKRGDGGWCVQIGVVMDGLCFVDIEKCNLLGDENTTCTKID